MTKIINLKSSLVVCMAAALALAACDKNKDGGVARLGISIDADNAFTTKALDEASYCVPANYSVNITGGVDYNQTFAPGSVPSYLEIPFGSYTVKAYMGEEHAASRNEFLCVGETVVNLKSEERKDISIHCTPTCGKAAVIFAAEMDSYFTEYYVSYSTPALGTETVTWAKGDTEPWYLAVDKAGSDVTATIHLVAKPEYALNQSYTPGAASEGTVVKTYKLMRDKAWTLNIAPNYNTAKGELGISITLDESTNDSAVDIEIPSEWV